MKKGFTLIELVAVITIIGILAIITTPAYNSISKNVKKTNYLSKQNSIKKQTISYVEKYLKNDVFDGIDSNNVLCLSVKFLIHNGIISSDSEKKEYIENNVTGKKYYVDKEDSKNFVKVYYDTTNLRLNAAIKDDFETDYDSIDCDIEY